MSFDLAFRHEKQEPTSVTHASADLFNRVHQESPIKLASAQGGGLEPGPGNPTGPIEPPSSTTNNVTNINNAARGGDARSSSLSSSHSNAEAASRSNAASSSRVGDVSSTSTGSSYSSKTIFTAPPSLGGGECTMGLSGGALGFALGGQLPSMDCIREKTGAQKDGQLLNFSVQSGQTAVDAYDHALANVDKASEYHKKGENGVARAHLDGANAQRQISGSLATESVTAAQKVLGPEATANNAGSWSADILNDNTPPAPPPAPEIRVIIPGHGTQVHHRTEHHKAAPAADCVDKK